jgi:hypothetical protein
VAGVCLCVHVHKREPGESLHVELVGNLLLMIRVVAEQRLCQSRCVWVRVCAHVRVCGTREREGGAPERCVEGV